MKLLGAVALLSSLTAAGVIHSPSGRSPRDTRVSYDGYRVYRVAAGTAPADLEKQLKSYHTIPLRGALEVAIPPDEVKSFEALGLDAELLNDDLGRDIAAEASSMSAYSPAPRKRGGELPDLGWYDTYHMYDDHLRYWEDLQAAFPGNSELFDLGPSYEGRRIFALRLWGDGGGDRNASKPVILWHATVHAREWISTMVIEYLTYQLIDGYKAGDGEVRSLLDYYDFYMVPFHNPDGFVYSQTTDRLWRKNRQPRAGTDCVGTDGNRNWDSQWDHPIPGAGGLGDPCSQTYHGEAPGDTPENAALSALSRRLAAAPGGGGGIRSMVDWHSYGQQILLPYGWSCEPADLPANLAAQRAVGGGYAAAIDATTGASYEVGPACDVLYYYSTGSARDYHSSVSGAPFSWTVELRPQGAAGGGFVLPPESIWPTVREHWEGIKYVLDAVR
ncbi:hypothetical protein DL762_003757 [Monosporascus cannonballus]|uniref:Peptidase M14 domain-containing protein n=1 Tax=Monosporascus cannonballus TaxID=155416 RepID=A0ABY0H9L5_9PEZI|nr:hypothetical protein DL762_003757 [Monosporascus cannonballus]RYO96315.1 hypothetical protein DL763_003288 [Monosporascus cannonballus]